KHGLVALCAFRVDKVIDDDARVDAQAQRRLVVEGHAERPVRARLQGIASVDGVAHLYGRCRGVTTGDRGRALQGRDLTDRLVGIVGILGCGRLVLRAGPTPGQWPCSNTGQYCDESAALHSTHSVPNIAMAP